MVINTNFKLTKKHSKKFFLESNINLEINKILKLTKKKTF